MVSELNRNSKFRINNLIRRKIVSYNQKSRKIVHGGEHVGEKNGVEIGGEDGGQNGVEDGGKNGAGSQNVVEDGGEKNGVEDVILIVVKATKAKKNN